MEYEEFKKALIKELQNLYGSDAEAEIYEVKKNNGQGYDGIQIPGTGAGYSVAPVVNIDGLYEAYRSGNMEMAGCAEEVYRKRKEYEAGEEIVKLAGRLTSWESVKENVYPFLLSTKENKELFENLVSMPLLDLSVAYMVRMEMERGYSSVKINKNLLKHYGIGDRELHNQALKNLAEDGYKFQSMGAFMEEMSQKGQAETNTGGRCGAKRQEIYGQMYILTNEARTYGAAGILDKKLIREFAGKRDFFILPSSLHETIFVPVSDIADKEIFDHMVQMVNEEAVSAEERLSDHCYFYDGQTEEIRMCA